MKKRIVLTRDELDALIGIGGDVDAQGSLESQQLSEAEQAKQLAAWESGMEKLRIMLARKESP